MPHSYRELSILIDIKLQLFCNVQTLMTDLLQEIVNFMSHCCSSADMMHHNLFIASRIIVHN